MEYDLIFSSRSETETKSAIDYYDQISPVIGDNFFIELLEIYQKLSANPQYYSFISSTRATSLRDVKLSSFPYVVIFEIVDNFVYVISVMNTHKRPFLQ